MVAVLQGFWLIAVVIAVGWLLLGLPKLRDHLNGVSSFKLGPIWIICVSVVTPIVLGFMLIQQIMVYAQEGYEGYPTWHLLLFGWGLIAALAYLSYLISIIPWPRKSLDRVARARAEFEAEAGGAPSTTTTPTGGEEA